MFGLTELRELATQEIITPGDHARVQSRIEVEGGQVLTTLAEEIGERDVAVWRALAGRARMPFFETHKALMSLEGHQMPYRNSLELGVLPHRRQYLSLHVLTHDPTVQSGTLTALGHHVTVCLVTPRVYQRVSALIYPRIKYDTFSEAEALAIATLGAAQRFLGMSIEACLSTRQITPTQAAMARAIQQGYEYVDPALSPPDPSALGLLPMDTMELYRVYPYRVRADQVVQVLMSTLDPLIVRGLGLTMQRRIEPVMTSEQALDTLLSAGLKQHRAVDELMAALGPLPAPQAPGVLADE